MALKLSSLQKGLVAHYPLDEASLKSSVILGDKTPNNNDGVSANTPNFVSDRFGHTRAMSFNGTSDAVDCGNDGLTDTNYFMSFWINPNDVEDNAYLFSYDNDKRVVLIGYQDGHFNFFDGTGYPTGNPSDTQFVATTNEWQHIIMGTDGTKVYAYRNGIKVIDVVGTWAAGASNFCIGARYDGSFHFAGSLADIRIYNRALSPAEITMLFQEYRSKISMGSLMKGLVLDLPLTSQRYNAGNSKFDDLTPYENRGANSGATIGADYASFNGTSDNIRIPDSASLSPTSAMSAMCWVKGAGQDKYLFSHYESSGNQRAFAFRYHSINKVNVYISEDGASTSGHFKNYQSSIVSLDNSWHLIGFTFDAGTLKLFIDGIEDTNPTKTVDDAITTIHNSTADIAIGCYFSLGSPSGFFAGDIAYARMYNRALTAAEWLLVFEKQKGEFL